MSEGHHTFRRWMNKTEPYDCIKQATFPPQLFSSLEYEPLDENQIRVLYIHSARLDDDAVHCSLSTKSIKPRQSWPIDNQDDRYYALSYAWGPTFKDGSHLTEKILCDGKVVGVTHHLHAALKRIRQNMVSGDLDSPVGVWVDALCINQRDLNERSSQVRIMSLIYRQAFGLLIWLGEIEPEEQRDLEFIKDYDRDKHHSFSQDQRHAIQQIMKRSYFRRRWVIQEVQSSLERRQYVILGALAVRGEGFRAVLRDMDLMNQVRVLYFTGWSTRQSNILYNLQVFDDAECSDPRDKIYALLSLTGEHESARFPIDYSKSVEDCYLAFASYEVGGSWMSRRNAVGLLACATTRASGPGSGTSLPTWVPDWRSPIKYRSKKDQSLFWKSLDMECESAHATVVNENTLVVQGRLLRPCPNAKDSQNFGCRDCPTCIFSRAALRTEAGMHMVATLSWEDGEGKGTALLVFGDLPMSFWLRPLSHMPMDSGNALSAAPVWALSAAVGMPHHAQDCHYLTRTGDEMPLEQVCIG